MKFSIITYCSNSHIQKSVIVVRQIVKITIGLDLTFGVPVFLSLYIVGVSLFNKNFIFSRPNININSPKIQNSFHCSYEGFPRYCLFLSETFKSSFKNRVVRFNIFRYSTKILSKSESDSIFNLFLGSLMKDFSTFFNATLLLISNNSSACNEDLIKNSLFFRFY